MAIGDEIKAVQLSLGRQGKPVSLRWIYKQCEPPTAERGRDPYAQFLLWLRAIEDSRQIGVDEILADMWSRVRGWRRHSRNLPMLSRVMVRRDREQSETYQAIMTSENFDQIEHEIIQDIAVLFQLRTLVDERREEVAQLRGRELAKAA